MLANGGDEYLLPVLCTVPNVPMDDRYVVPAYRVAFWDCVVQGWRVMLTSARPSLSLPPDLDEAGELGFMSRGAMVATELEPELLWSSMVEDIELRED